MFDLDPAHDHVRDDISDAAQPRTTRVYTGFYPDTVRRTWEGE